MNPGPSGRRAITYHLVMSSTWVWVSRVTNSKLRARHIVDDEADH